MQAASRLKDIILSRGSKFAIQMFNMWKFHRTPFSEILMNIFDVLDDTKAKFTFPTVASVALKSPEETKSILKNNHEIASHGFKHLRYRNLTKPDIIAEFDNAEKAFKTMKIPIKGFRAPYNGYNEDVIEEVVLRDFLWDGGIGFQPQYRSKNQVFTLERVSKDDLLCVSLHYFTDDVLIDRYQLSVEKMKQIYKKELLRAIDNGDVLMLDLHPIRIGQSNYIEVLKHIVEVAYENNAWIPSMSEFANRWISSKSYADKYSMVLLLTGDIDNFIFFDYMRRFT